MADIRTCKECGRQFDNSRTGGADHGMKSSGIYCSAKCERSAEAARDATRSFSFGSSSSASSSAAFGGRMTLAIPFLGIILVIGLIGLAVDRVKNAFSSIKIDTVSANCTTGTAFVSIVEKALSGVLVTEIDGEEFTTYSRQAFDAVKERGGKYSTFKDTVYFVKLPDKVNVYIWFQTEDQASALVYKTN